MFFARQVFREPSEALLRDLSIQTKWLAQEVFIIGKSDSRLIRMTETHLVLYDENESIWGVLPLNFDAKFQTIPGEVVMSLTQKPHQYLGMLIYGLPCNTPVQLRHSSPEVINLWKEFLLRFINRIGFKSYFKKTMKIGKGSFASVHLALGLESSFKVAIKSYDVINVPKTRLQSVMNEITILRSINHHNLNKLLGVYEEDNQWHIIIELFDGGQLAYKIQSKYKFSSIEIKTVVKSILLGLEHLHSRNIYHRDLKPQNIMFRSKNSYDVVIVDFGLSTFVTEKSYLFYRCGTPGFMAPEMLRAKKNVRRPADPIGDIFSLGIIFHILLTGSSLFSTQTYDQLLLQNQLCEFDLDSPAYSIFTRATVDLLKKMLDTNPYTRISAEEALGHPFFNEKQVKRNHKSAQILIPELKFDSYSEQTVKQLNQQIQQAKRYRSKEKANQQQQSKRQ